MQETTPIGFIGLGSMGEPMAHNLARNGNQLLVWNRTSKDFGQLVAKGVKVASSAAEVFSHSRTIILMLASDRAIDEVLGRGTLAFADRVRNHTVIQMGTTSAAYSKSLADDISSNGGQYVEAPVSGSRKPAEAGTLIAMLAGKEELIERVGALLAPMCRQVIFCGPSPNALLMKLAVNTFLISMVTGLTEATNFARHQGLDLKMFEAILNASPMASEVSCGKLAKIVNDDFSPHASISDVLMNSCLITNAAREKGIASPLLDVCRQLLQQAVVDGRGAQDMAAVMMSIEARNKDVKEGNPLSDVCQ